MTQEEINDLLERPQPTCASMLDIPMYENMLRWLLTGEVGASAKAMGAHLCGFPCSGCSPSDPGDFARCLMLLDAVPELRAELHRMAEVNLVWAALVARWNDIEATFRGEVPSHFWRSGRWDAPRTMKLMREVLDEAGKATK